MSTSNPAFPSPVRAPGSHLRPPGSPRTEPRRDDPRVVGSERVAARRRRTRTLRRRAVAVAVGLFIVLWIVIFGQLIGGHDPALASTKAAGATSSAKATTVRASSSGSAAKSSGSSATTGSSAASSSGSSTGSAVVTRQS